MRHDDFPMFALDRARRRAALVLFRIASSILQKGIELHESRKISRLNLRLRLSITAFLERRAGLLLIGWRERRRRLAGPRIVDGERSPKASPCERLGERRTPVREL
ncbi:MAG TPA: hypothetical protein VKW08_28095 [Xanthobacteraceae bacterium]|jgi:hypothetical protein|nr:hypothetical protein [Xanthobacteraceae bacterium]